MTTYSVTVQTGKKRGAGTDGRVTLTLVGTEGESGPHVLDRALRDDFEAGSVMTYDFEGAPVGEILAVRLRNENDLGDDWLLDEIHVREGGATRRFPYFRWVLANGEALVLDGAAHLPQHVDGRRAELRRANIERRREAYRWGAPAIPGLGQLEVSDEHPLPLDEHYREIGERNYEATYLKTAGQLGLARPLLSGAWSAIDRIGDLLEYVGKPKLALRWRDDREFARLVLQGVSPTSVARADALPEGFPLTDEDLPGVLDPGVTLASAFAARRMYILDCGLLDGVPMYQCMNDEGEADIRYAPPVRALFYRGDDGDLRPVAIQLERGPHAPVFTPLDAEPDWLAAKLFMRCAEGNVHQVLVHAVNTHFTVEPFIVAMMRNVSSQHPVYKLARRHFRYTLALNQGARKILLAPGGVFDEFMSCGGPDQGHIELARRAWANWRFAAMRLPDDLARRGVGDAEALPYYPYRDDAKPLWDIVGRYVHGTLAHFYRSDDDLRDDAEVQDFWRDLTAYGIPADRFPYAALTRREDLYDLLQTVIFTVTVMHAAVNNLQFEQYAWVPAAPLGMHRPPPTVKGVITMEDVREMLPNLSQSIGQIAIGRALSTFGTDEEFLLPEKGWPANFFEEPGALAAQREFFSALRAQCTRVENANRDRAMPYEILRPDRIPCSITI